MIVLQDSFGHVESTRKYTQEGFLRARGLVARTGIQDYYGLELGFKETPFRKFRIYRPENVVFNQNVLDSLLGVDITNDHPNRNVSSATYKQLTCGVVVSTGVKDTNEPEYVACDLLIKDKQAIANVEAGKCELSAGYNSEIVFEDGVTPDGQQYDGRIASISFNHVAIVEKGRAGHARILDSGVSMNTLKIGEREVQFADDVNHEAIQSAIDDVMTQLNDSRTAVESANVQIADLEKTKSSLEAQIADFDKVKAEHDSQIAELEAKLADAQSKILTDADIVNLVKTLEDVRAKALQIAGDKFVCDSADTVEIMKTALKIVDSKLDFEGKSDDYVRAYFDAAVSMHDASASSHKKLADAIANPKKTDVKDSYKDLVNEISNAWKSN